MIRRVALGCGLALGAAASTAWGATFAGTNFGTIPDGGAGCAPSPGAVRDVTFAVSGVAPPLLTLSVSVTLAHTWTGDVVALLIAPNATSFVLFGRVGAVTAAGVGDSSDLGGSYLFSDFATGDLWTEATLAGATTAIPPGAYRTTQIGGAWQSNPAPATSLDAAFVGIDPNGTWTLRLTDGCTGDVGSVTAASLTLNDVIFADGFEPLLP